VVARHRSRAVISDRPGALTERVPDRATAPVRSDRTLNLVSRRGDSPAEPIGKLDPEASREAGSPVVRD
jgi:hypothetical protein